MILRCRAKAAANERDPLSLSKSLFLSLSLSRREHGGETSEEKMSFLRQINAYSKTLKYRLRKSLLVLTPQSVSSRWTFLSKKSPKSLARLQNFSTLFSREKEREEKRDDDAFSSGELPESGISLLTERDLSFFLSLSLSLCFRVLLSFSRDVLLSSSRLCLCLCQRIANRKRNWKMLPLTLSVNSSEINRCVHHASH